MNLFNSQITINDFIETYWQKKPLLLKKAIDPKLFTCDADELAGLSLEEEVESRLIIFDHANNSWQLEHGPLADDRFSYLPDNSWTLLIQDADHWLDHLSALRDYVNFVPNWRFDDVMVSYATKGGGVGPHVDSYDVFLVQGLGRRQWLVGKKDAEIKADRRSGALKQILPFEIALDTICEPGDILYLPANTAHHGIAMEHCITYSIGFRNPSLFELGDNLANQLAANSKPLNFCDQLPKKLHLQVSNQEINAVKKQFLESISDNNRFINTFLSAATSVKFHLEPEVCIQSTSELKDYHYHHQTHCRYASYSGDEGHFIAINGDVFPSSKAFALWLDNVVGSQENQLKLDHDEDLRLLLKLCNLGFLELHHVDNQ